ncbi:MAG: flagellar filament capping protein FliD [Desulfobulbus sp.]|nr:flagellar filament capping protein FliD [Desulfobulbus sp.]
MTIQFGGLATGLDTSSIIDQLMELERRPLSLLEKDKTWLNSRLKAFTELDTKLKSFADGIRELGDANTLLQRSILQSSDALLTARVDSSAQAGASYQVEVVSLAQVQKSVSAGVASKTDAIFGTGTMTLTLDGDVTARTIGIGEGQNSLTGIMNAINTADLGVRASIINDGSATPFRLVLTGNDPAKSFALDASGLGGGIALDLGAPVQQATRAHIRVDTIDIYSDSNTLTEAIPGVSLDLTRAEVGTLTSLNVTTDRDSIKATIEGFAKGYNEVVGFITSQSAMNGAKGGVLGGDSGIGTIKRRLQTMLTQPLANSGVFTALSQLGFETRKDGTLQVNEKTLNAAIDGNLDSVVSLLAGENGVDGIAGQFQDYLDTLTDSVSGLLKGRKDSIDSNLRRLDTRITSMEMRLEKRQQMLERQFSAMESLISGLNAQSSYLSQQMTAITNMMSGNKQ